jgi:hypothetical protein
MAAPPCMEAGLGAGLVTLATQLPTHNSHIQHRTVPALLSLSLQSTSRTTILRQATAPLSTLSSPPALQTLVTTLPLMAKADMDTTRQAPQPHQVITPMIILPHKLHLHSNTVNLTRSTKDQNNNDGEILEQKISMPEEIMTRVRTVAGARTLSLSLGARAVDGVGTLSLSLSLSLTLTIRRNRCHVGMTISTMVRFQTTHGASTLHPSPFKI